MESREKIDNGYDALIAVKFDVEFDVSSKPNRLQKNKYVDGMRDFHENY